MYNYNFTSVFSALERVADDIEAAKLDEILNEKY